MPDTLPEFNRLPVRAIIKGKRLVNNAYIDFEEYLDYFNFVANSTIEEYFQVI